MRIRRIVGKVNVSSALAVRPDTRSLLSYKRGSKGSKLYYRKGEQLYCSVDGKAGEPVDATKLSQEAREQVKASITTGRAAAGERSLPGGPAELPNTGGPVVGRSPVRITQHHVKIPK